MDGGALYQRMGEAELVSNPGMNRCYRLVGTLAQYLGVGTGAIYAGWYHESHNGLNWAEPHHFEGRFGDYDCCEHCTLPSGHGVHLVEPVEPPEPDADEVRRILEQYDEGRAAGNTTASARGWMIYEAARAWLRERERRPK